MTTKKKLENYLSMYPGGYGNLHALRWLHKRNENLYNEIIELTDFLDETAKPKQRAWHILNEIFKVPVCPITGKQVKWHENRYLTYIDRKQKYKDPKCIEKRQSTMMNRFGVKHALQSNELKQKAINTWITKYGVENPSHSENVLNKIRNSNYDKGTWTNPDSFPKEISYKEYRRIVDALTKTTYIANKEKINPNDLARTPSDYNLDHEYSIIDAYVNRVAPEVVSHWSNLRMIPFAENIRKKGKSNKSIEQLYEDFENNR